MKGGGGGRKEDWTGKKCQREKIKKRSKALKRGKEQKKATPGETSRKGLEGRKCS